VILRVDSCRRLAGYFGVHGRPLFLEWHVSKYSFVSYLVVLCHCL
jgi:hypothetical protein